MIIMRWKKVNWAGSDVYVLRYSIITKIKWFFEDLFN